MVSTVLEAYAGVVLEACAWSVRLVCLASVSNECVWLGGCPHERPTP